MWNASDFVAMAAIAAGAAGSVALYSALAERSPTEVRTIVVEGVRGPAVAPSIGLRWHPPEPPQHLRHLPRPNDLRIQHVPYVVFEDVARTDPYLRGEDEGHELSFEVDGRRFRLYRDGRAVEIEKRRDRRPDRKRKRRPRDIP